MKIFPAIDIKDKKCVRLVKGNFDNKTEYEMSPIEQARNYKNYGFKNLHIVDLDGALTGEIVNLDIIQEIITKCDLKIEIGGGIRNLESIQKYTDAGLEKVIRDRSAKGGIGFSAEVTSKDSQKSIGETLLEVEPEDLIGYGLIPEFIGRLPMIATLEFRSFS